MSTNTRDFKREAAQQWSERACGFLDDPSLEAEGESYFAAVDRDRYESYAPWLRPAIAHQRFAHKDVLEIGFGQGTDLMQFARAGARSVRGFDLSTTHLRLATRRFELARIPADLRIQDAEAPWPLPDESLDVVYSFGVLHHTPHPELAIREAYRCLRPGGTIIIGLYHKWSLFALARLMEWIGHGEFRSEGYGESFWRIEEHEEGTTARTLVNRYSRSEARALIEGAGFVAKRTIVDHYGVEKFRYLGFIPRALWGWLGRRWGWYVIVEAGKPLLT
jgi:SAM-dependent methyltransferase